MTQNTSFEVTSTGPSSLTKSIEISCHVKLAGLIFLQAANRDLASPAGNLVNIRPEKRPFETVPGYNTQILHFGVDKCWTVPICS